MDNVEIPNWLKKLPLAPTFYPTDTEFLDPIAYISKIEKEASVYGICKVIPPLPKPSKKYVFSNLNKSLLKFPELGPSSSPLPCDSGDKDINGENRAVFTTRHQELGCSSKRAKGQVSVQQSGVHKQVWQSGEVYTLEQFESKAKSFARNQLGTVKEVTPLVVEALFWKLSSEKPIYIEYANDVPGSGFGEPEEVCQYFHRRRRRRQFNRNHQENHNNEKHKIDTSRNAYVDRPKDVLMKDDLGSPCETSRQPLNSPDLMSEETSRIRSQNSLNVGKEMEGTAGWKLSNSPWNLQVIARSPGSLTRFMLDDIPGVTSPMVYIGMLFSWFAWHVEDHELHSLNFLHTGSSKSWYAVPGEYAFRFEEVIRSEGYGANLDRLAALTLLGEKTNLLSPEIVVASGIPCCRLIQNPGEFVVTFPRAYHIGFSQGFNCGEAANFGTPQWLKVAKAAAIRRAAMNYLPMLSHQQLLYMLTMSFVSRVPKALLSGARTSRSKDRQKEERELLIKKAFIDDMLNEKNLLSVLLGKQSTFYAVLWDPETIPSPDETSIFAMSIERTTVGYQNDDSCNNQVDSTRMPREVSEDSNLDDDDLPCGLHVDSGTLACVACGVLGFPFMSIVQPSWRASEELFPADFQVSQVPEDLRSMKSYASPGLCEAVMESASDEHCCYKNQKVSSICGREKENNLWRFYNNAISTPSEVVETKELKQSTSLPFSSNVELDCSKVHCVDVHPLTSKDRPLDSSKNSHKKWNTCNDFLRPRVFCLEHAIEIERLLHSKGGANVLVICHSAYSKIKAHAFAVAEEIKAPFECDEIPLQCASKEDIDLITISIDGTEHEEGGEDWTSRLGLNLRCCVKLRKLYPSKQEEEEEHALALGGLFCNRDDLNLKWKSRRCRTAYKTGGARRWKSCGGSSTQNDVVVEKTNENKVMQYSRRSYNRKAVSRLQACNGSSEESRGIAGISEVSDAVVKRAGVAKIEYVSQEVSSVAAAALVDRSVDKTNKNENSEMSDISDPTKSAPISEASASQQPTSLSSSMVASCEERGESQDFDEANKGGETCTSSSSSEEEAEDIKRETTSKRRRGVDQNIREDDVVVGFIKSPCEGLRPRGRGAPGGRGVVVEAAAARKKAKRCGGGGGLHRCEFEGCGMRFKTKEQLNMHKGNRCTHKGCRKQFSSHRYAMLHQRVHTDERPLKCPWKDCNMSFKWAWARTEHLRLHTGERPYQCNIDGCGLTFRFVSDFSRHKRNTGHYYVAS